MSSARLKRRGSSVPNLVIPETKAERRVSLTGITNVVLDVSSNSSKHNEDKDKVRVRFAEVSSVGLAMSGYGDKPSKRKYSVALQTLKPFRPSSKDGKLPMNKVGLFSYIFLSWFSGFVWKMYRNRAQPVNENDVWQCSDAEGLGVNTDRLRRLWNEELQKNGEKKASFLKIWIRFSITRTWVALLMLSINALATFASSALLVNKVVAYLESPEDDLWYGIGMCIAIFSCEVIRAITFANMIIFSCQTSTRFRSGMMGLVYDKLLRMRSVKGKTNSEIINVFGVDSYRVYMATWTVGFLLSLPIYVIIGTVYCYILIGYWCFVSIGTFAVCYFAQAEWLTEVRSRYESVICLMLTVCLPAWCLVFKGRDREVNVYRKQTNLTRFIASVRRLCVQYTDLRVRRMGEVLNSMKFIKMYAWEKPFTDAIKDVRMSEQKYVLRGTILNGIITSIIPITPTIASVVTISVYTSVGNQLTASTAFAVIGTMNFLRIIVALLPFALRAYAEAKVSFDRIRNLMLMEEHTKPNDEVFDQENAIEIKAANFVWEIMPDPSIQLDGKKFNHHKEKRKSSVASLADSRRASVSNFALSDINLDVKKGSLVGICGSVGGGKSSLTYAILGRMIQQKGHLAVVGEVAYVAQQAWIFNATLKENILFGKDYDEFRYKEVITCCGLDPDIQMLSDGDETEIGERGTNLSGGQKQRVNLARAVYSDSDIIILDDPMSALDVKVGKQIFHSCIKGVLKGKTVLLVTHQLQYLKHCDEVMVMEEGSIEEKGLHHELIENDGIYANMFRIFDNTTMKPVKTEGATNDGQSTPSNNKKPKTPSSPTKEQNGTHTNGILKVKKSKKKLVLAEESVIGDITFGTYNAYIKAAGGWLLVTSVILVYFISAGSLVFTDWWLSQWLTALNPSPTSLSSTSMHNASEDNLTFVSHSVMEMSTTPESSFKNGSTGIPGDAGYSTLLGYISNDTYFLVYVFCIAGILILEITKSIAGALVAVRASNRLHASCLDNVMKAKMFFFDSNPVGRILNRFSKDLDESDVFIPQVTHSLLQILALVIISTAMIAYITPWILIAIVPLLLIFYIMKQMSSVAIRQLKRLENITRSPLISHVNASSTGLSTIVAYNQQDRFVERCHELGDIASLSLFLFDVSMRWIGLRLDLVAGMLTVTTSLIFVITKGAISPASAGLVLGLCGKTISIVQFVVRLMNEAEARFTSIERLQEYNTNVETEPQHGEKLTEPKWPDKGEVVFKDVVMRYRKDMDPVLRSVNFQIGSQEKVGVVGRTGAGKSSLAAALFRLVELGGGKIFVDGEDISKLHLNAIRSKVSTITQEPVLFAGTVRYNIDPFSIYSDDQIWSALERVHMKEKIEEYNEGLEVMVEENGENFSVGERQLMCLARALLRSSKILLLDEATANIDTSTDAMIQQTIQECFTDCTVITIAHRLNTVLHSDRIIVLDSGQVMECASPQDLLTDPNSYFNSMISAQSVKTPSP